jgi:hypothetical protein
MIPPKPYPFVRLTSPFDPLSNAARENQKKQEVKNFFKTSFCRSGFTQAEFSLKKTADYIKFSEEAK